MRVVVEPSAGRRWTRKLSFSLTEKVIHNGESQPAGAPVPDSPHQERALHSFAPSLPWSHGEPVIISAQSWTGLTFSSCLQSRNLVNVFGQLWSLYSYMISARGGS